MPGLTELKRGMYYRSREIRIQFSNALILMFDIMLSIYKYHFQ